MTNLISPDQKDTTFRMPSDLADASDETPSLSAPAHDAGYTQDTTGGMQTFRRYTVIIALFLSLFVAALDVTIIATAAPTISNDLSSSAGYTWIGGAFLLTSVTTSPIWVKLSDIWGRKVILVVLLAWLSVASTICATAKNIEALLAGRALQGAASGGLVLLVHVCISDLFSLRKRSLLLGLTEGVWAVAGGIGPVLGGAFSSLSTWRWCFWINLPMSALAAFIIIYLLDIKHEHTSFKDGVRALDWAGMVTFLGCSVMLLLGLDFGGIIFPWNSAKVIALLAAGGILIFAFVYSEVKIAKYPLMPMDIFAKGVNVAILLLTLCHGLAFMSAEYYLPVLLQSSFGASPLRSGLLLLPFITTTAISGIVCGVFIHRTGRFQEIMWVGALCLCLGFGLFVSFNLNTSTSQIIGYQLIGGLGSGFLFETPIIAIQSQVRLEDMATATSTLCFIRNIGITLSVIIGGSFFQSSMDKQIANLDAVGLPQELVVKYSGSHVLATILSIRDIQDQTWKTAVENAVCLAMRNVWILFTAVAFAGFVASLFVRQGHLTTEHTVTGTGLKKKPQGDTAISL
ncbi:major facilitator superfamily transporter [Phlyctema vagabunda]|uniref:Major facilitator superfamily transporter n=1 Tax=Phlyctema vagabunda TaxID=108571 RepID=A0ABR4P226_9HELO